MKKKLALALAFASLVTLGAAKSADATVILSFGQNGNVNTITSTNNGAGATTIAGTNIAVTVTQIDAGVVTPFAAFLTLSANSTGAATTDGTGQINWFYSGQDLIDTDARTPWTRDIKVVKPGQWSVYVVFDGVGSNGLTFTFVAK